MDRSPTCRQVWCACPQMLCWKREGFIYSYMSIDGQTQPSTSCCETYFTLFDLLMMLEFGNHPLTASTNTNNHTYLMGYDFGIVLELQHRFCGKISIPLIQHPTLPAWKFGNSSLKSWTLEILCHSPQILQGLEVYTLVIRKSLECCFSWFAGKSF